MSLRVEIKDDIKNAMKAKDNDTRDALRMLDSAMKQIEVDERKELSDDDVIKIITKQIKQRNDSIEQYAKGGREDLVAKESKEIGIFSKYMPRQLNDDELKSALVEIIAEAGATSLKDMGKIMGVASAKLGSSADGKRINECVKAIFG